VPIRVHGLVQDAYDIYPFHMPPVEDDVAAPFDSSQVSGYLIAGPAEVRILCEPLAASLNCARIPFGLFRTPVGQRITVKLQKV
jgi:hypothetical protein